MRKAGKVFGLSERRACKLLGQPRSTQRHQLRERPGDQLIVQAMLELSREYPRYGWRRIRVLLRLKGIWVSKKRARLLWREAGLKVPRKVRKRRARGCSENSCVMKKAEYPNHVWSYDFVHERTTYGRRLKVLVVVDEFTRECLAMEVSWKLGSKGVLDVLGRLFRERGTPAHIRSDNGPEFVAKAVRLWLKKRGTTTLFIEPGSPWENGYVESFNGRLRDEFTQRWLFSGVREARVLFEQHRRWYNEERIHSGIGYQTPASYAARIATAALAG